MRKAVTIQQKEEIISKSILWKRDTMQDQKEIFQEEKMEVS